MGFQGLNHQFANTDPGRARARALEEDTLSAEFVKEVTFNELLTRRTIVSVYMRNNTPGCDRQNDSLIAHAEKFTSAGFNLVALSRDTCGSHWKYAAKKKIS